MIPCPEASECPYLSKSDCLMTVGGLYLPLQEHIENFCKTGNYSKCYHYIVGCEQIRNAAPKVENGVVNRRRYRRVMERLPLVLSEPILDGDGATLIDDSAYTFDMSMGGVGFITSRRIAPKTKVRFTLRDSGGGLPLIGAGIVQWATSNSSDSALFLSGLSFTDKKCQQIVGRRMWSSEQIVA